MAIRKIAQLGEPVLRQKARELSAEELLSPRVQSLIDDMVDTMRDADGAGLAAPQVYESISLCVIEVANNPRYPEIDEIPLLVLANPVVRPEIESSPAAPADRDSILMYEGCLSIQGLRGQVRRPRRVRVSALDRAGRPIEFVWEGLRAAVVQHETDHLNGILFVDRADPRTLAFLREYGRHVPAEARVIDGGAAPVSRSAE